MSANIPQWIVRKSAVNYIASVDGSEINLRANNPSEANLVFDNTLGTITGIFSPEDEVEVYIGSVSAANKMMVGYIDSLHDVRRPDRRWEGTLHITDWGSYLAGKTVFENDYYRTKTGATVLNNAAAEIAGLATNITAINTSAENMKRQFQGTYVKDAWHAVAENCGADFFVDETKTLQAFLHGARNLTESGTGLIYKIKDIAPVTADTLMVEHNFPYQFMQDVSNRYRTVIASNGLIETFPSNIDEFITQQIKHDQRGKIFSKFFRHFGAQSEYDVTTTTIKPFDFNTSTDVGGLTMPTLFIIIASTATDADTFLQGANFDASGNLVTENMAIVVTDWQRVAFFIKTAFVGPAVNKIRMRLYTSPVGANYWEREIQGDLVALGSWTYIEYSLPANTTDASSNGWAKVGSPTTIDAVFFRFENGAGVLDGYTAGSGVYFGKFHFSRRQRATVTGAGSPATEKIIIDATMKSKIGLTTLATKEQARSNVVSNEGFCTILGNQAFKKPAHLVQIDFTNTLGAGRSTTSARLEEIRHFLKYGRYFTELSYKPAFRRP